MYTLYNNIVSDIFILTYVWTSWAHIWLAWFCSLENRVWHLATPTLPRPPCAASCSTQAVAELAQAATELAQEAHKPVAGTDVTSGARRRLPEGKGGRTGSESLHMEMTDSSQCCFLRVCVVPGCKIFLVSHRMFRGMSERVFGY
jgi:hypothetical protein